MYELYSSHMLGTPYWEQQGFEFSNNSVIINVSSGPDEIQTGFCASDESKSHVVNDVAAANWNFEFPNTANSTTSVAESLLSTSTADSSYYQQFPQHAAATTEDKTPFQISFHTNQMDSFTKPEKQCCRDGGVACVTSSNSASKRSFPTRKRRIRWTKDLNDPFMTIVNRLGGPNKAKPKAILAMMKSDLLSIAHIKSHLQKYRSTMYQHKASQERSEERHETDGVTHELRVKLHMQIEESRQLQLEVRRSIHQQIEIQRNLQQLIEQQREQLKIMLHQQKERTKSQKNL